MEKMLLSARDLQTLAGVSRRNAYQLLNREDLPVVHVGERKYMLTSDFMEWLRHGGDVAREVRDQD